MIPSQIARRAILRSRQGHSNRQLKEMAGLAMPPMSAWFAYIASCGLEVPDKKTLMSKIREGGFFAREVSVVVKTLEGQLEYRFIAYDGRFHMRQPRDEEEQRQIRLGNLKRINRRVKQKLRKNRHPKRGDRNVATRR